MDPIEMKLALMVAIAKRATREGLWDMSLKEVDLEAMTEEIVEELWEKI